MALFSRNRIIFVGTRPLASKCLQYLIDISDVTGIEIVGVVGIAKDTYGWWSKNGIQELWQISEKYALPYISEKDIHLTESEYLICVNWGTIFKKEVLNTPVLGCLNLHTAPLPDYRGCHCYTHAIMNREKFYGTTLHFMSERIDEGDILSIKHFPIMEKDTAFSLYERASEYSFPMFCEAIWRLLDGSYERVSQKEYAVQNSKSPAYYNEKSINKYIQNESCKDSKEYLDLLRRALYFPHKIEFPKWLL